VPDYKRWLALIALCLGVLMTLLDATIVNVALPSIREDLQIREASLVWVVNAYMLTFGGFLLLGGRLGDLYGHRKLFLIGIAMFTIASLACGLASSRCLLIGARAAQGLGGAVMVAVALSLITNMFANRAERTQAMGVYSFVCAAGGGIGLLLGGTLTSVLNWHWIFLVNLPIGVAVYTSCLSLLPNVCIHRADRRLDVWGAVTVMSSVVLASYAMVNSNEAGWTSRQTLGLLGFAAVFLAIFLLVEVRVSTPLLPLGIFRQRNLAISNMVGGLWAAGVSAWFFLSAMYMQLVLGYAPMQVSLAYLPGNVIAAAFAMGLSAKLVTRFGIKTPLTFGLLLVTIGLALFTRAPIDGSFVIDILPGMIILGLAGGIACNPLLLVAMSDVGPSESGVASGLVNTAWLIGGALGISIMTSVSSARMNELLASGETMSAALTGGYRVAFLLGAIFAGTATLLAATFIRVETRAPVPKHATIAATVPVSAED
jgi:EmrB/QacA subfamily drug resistance transporter